MRPRLNSLGFQLTAGFLVLVLLFGTAGLYAIGAFQRQLAYDALVEIAGRLELTAEQMHAQGMNYKQNAPRDYPTYYRDVRLYYQDLMGDIETFDRVIDTFMRGDLHGQAPTLLPWISPRLGAPVTEAIRELERVWANWREGLFQALGDDPKAPRLEWAAEHIIADHQTLNAATRSFSETLRAWTAGEYRRMVQGASGVALAAVLVAGALLLVLRRRVLGPLGRTIQGFQRVADGDFSHRLPVEGTSEIQDLTGSFNRLAARLDLLYQLISRLQQGKDLDEMVGFLGGEFRDLVGCDWIGVVFIDEARASARVESAWLDGQAQPGDRRLYRLQGTLLEAVLAAAQPRQIIDMVGQARDNPAYELLRHLVGLGMRDAIFLPLTPQSQAPLPAVVVFASRRAHSFDAAQGRLLGNIAQLLTQAFGRTARLAEQGRLASIGEFASAIAHELRTPLTTVAMALDYLAGQELNERGQRRADLGVQEAERMRRLLEDILLYAKPLNLDLRPLDLPATLTSLIDDDHQTGHAQVLRLEKAVPSVRVLADPDRMRQIFVNLTENARQAAPAGSPITWRIAPGPDPDEILVSVHNAGEPIPTALLGRITEPFVSTRSDGTGLGLAIVRRLVEQQGGEIRIRSASDLGTEVELSFPALRPHADTGTH